MNRKENHFAVKSMEASASIKDVDTVGRIVTGFYNSYNFLDSASDVLLMGCAKKSIKERGPNSDATAKIKHALNHDLTMLPGTIITLEEKTLDGITGIYFETRMADTQLGNDTLKNYLEGVYDNHSIGFRYVNVNIVERASSKAWDGIVEMLINPKAVEGLNTIYAVKEIQLYEGSTVAFGCNQLTPYLGAKSGNPDSYRLALMSRINSLSNTLKNGTQSDDMMESIAIQLLQFKQMTSELCDMIPAKKEIPSILSNEGVNKFSLK